MLKKMKLGFRKSENLGLPHTHWRIKGICFTLHPEWIENSKVNARVWLTPFRAERRPHGLSQQSPIWSQHGLSTCASPVHWRLYPRWMRGPPILLHQRREARAFHPTLRWFLRKKEGINHDTTQEIELRLALDRRNSHWLKFQWKNHV